jgi:hypothetical protein
MVTKKVILSDIAMYNGNEDKLTLTLEIMYFLSKKTVAVLKTVFEKAVHGIIPAVR